MKKAAGRRRCLRGISLEEREGSVQGQMYQERRSWCYRGRWTIDGRLQMSVDVSFSFRAAEKGQEGTGKSNTFAGTKHPPMIAPEGPTLLGKEAGTGGRKRRVSRKTASRYGSKPGVLTARGVISSAFLNLLRTSDCARRIIEGFCSSW